MFTQRKGGGDCFSQSFAKPSDSILEFNFEYMSYPVLNSNPANIGGFIGYYSVTNPPS